MRFLVTGGAGFIGSNMVEALIARGDEVVVLDDFSTGSMENLRGFKSGIRVLRGSARDVGNMDFGKIDGIFHFGMPSSSPMYNENSGLVGETINDAIALFEFARKSDCPVVFASTSSIYNGVAPPHREDAQIKPMDHYTEARIEIERLAELHGKLYGLNAAGMRFFSVYGPHEKAKGRYANVLSQFLWKMRENERPAIYGDGRQARDFVYAKDVARACELAMEKNSGFEVYNVGTGKKATFNDIVRMINRALGKKIEPRYVENPSKKLRFRHPRGHEEVEGEARLRGESLAGRRDRAATR